ncbi:MAG: DNA/RNA non-specific endonuclease [Flavobacteriaceae bacterium]|nr:DNA/RNA non-specific endonuclease [Flavobacteriaceae bacterium]
MKKVLSLVTLLVISVTLFAQDVVVLKHTNYTSHYSKSKKYPVMVEWWETRAKIGCPNPLPRKDNFKPDPLLPKETDLAADYIGSGYDRGHLMPAKSNQCQTQAVQDECFYFSNMAAQTHRLNAGDWKSLETMTREYAVKEDSVHIWAGNVGEIKRIGKVAVPKQCWKVVYFKKSNEWLYFVFENDQSKPDGIHNNEVTKEDIEKLTGLKFK